MFQNRTVESCRRRSLGVFARAKVEGLGTKGRSEHAKSFFFPENIPNCSCSNKQAPCDVMCKRLSGLSGYYTKLTKKATNEPIPALKYSVGELASILQHPSGG